ncbi:hypothetical protein KOR42_05900 [Thalassoglobus neptunius]|uniref:Uncharacterized protein n=1 Tax=Thalassoglobus neptunius TaxID=1938619 RepID=A0A5C5X5D8_9PLAN|nr:hypothetical protein [Thalassoglobus neptunius]TWT57232.1 hypothetical protein KOR42_05900 [Thalassoglobus neptunius]
MTSRTIGLSLIAASALLWASSTFDLPEISLPSFTTQSVFEQSLRKKLVIIADDVPELSAVQLSTRIRQAYEASAAEDYQATLSGELGELNDDDFDGIAGVLNGRASR